MGLIAAIRRAVGRPERTHLEEHGHRHQPWQILPGRALTSGCRGCVHDAYIADLLAESEGRTERRDVPRKGFDAHP